MKGQTARIFKLHGSLNVIGNREKIGSGRKLRHRRGISGRKLSLADKADEMNALVRFLGAGEFRSALNVKSYWEFASGHRPEGRNLWIAFNLSPKVGQKS